MTPDSWRTSVLRTGEGLPVTVFAPGGGATSADTEVWGGGVHGTGIFFEYERIAPWTGGDRPPPRREADRDADELWAVADEYQSTRALGVSRGARAVLGVLAAHPGRFERVVLVVPPGGRPAGRYASWLDGLATAAAPARVRATSADVLVVGRHGDTAHPARVAHELADRLSARLEMLPSPRLSTMREAGALDIVSEFLNRPS